MKIEDAPDLARKWINGSRKEVIAEIQALPVAQAAYVAARLYECLDVSGRSMLERAGMASGVDCSPHAYLSALYSCAKEPGAVWPEGDAGPAQAAAVVAVLREILWPAEDPDRQWEGDTIEKVATALDDAGFGPPGSWKGSP